MGWFSPIKGAYPSLAQVDKTLPVASGGEDIERGTIVALVKDDTGVFSQGVFKIASATDKLLYVSLQDYDDPTAGFAGTTFDSEGGSVPGKGAVPSVPAITGIDLSQDGEYETSMFQPGTYAVGDPLAVADGVLAKAGEGANVVGYVTAAFTRWVNNAIAVPNQANGKTDRRLAKRTGARVPVIRFRTKV